MGIKFALALTLALFSIFALGKTTTVESTQTVYANGLSFQSNVNVTVPSTTDPRWVYRHIDLYDLLIVPTIVYYSGEVNFNLTSSSADASCDVILGAISMPGFLSPNSPTVYLAYINATIHAQNLQGSLLSGASGSFSAAVSLVGKVAAKLEELNSQGFPVSTYYFKDLTYSSSGIITSSTNTNLKYVTYTATPASSWTVAFTFAVSNILGVLNVGNAQVTPRNLESIVEIQNYPYKMASNQLRLTVYLVHVSASETGYFTATNTLTSGSGNSEVYISVSSKAVINGAVQPVTISGLTSTTTDYSDLNNSGFLSQLQANSNATVTTDIRRVQITFPVGAAQISYDPTIGFAPPPSASSATSFIPTFSLLFVSLFLALKFF